MRGELLFIILYLHVTSSSHLILDHLCLLFHTCLSDKQFSKKNELTEWPILFFVSTEKTDEDKRVYRLRIDIL